MFKRRRNGQGDGPAGERCLFLPFIYQYRQDRSGFVPYRKNGADWNFEPFFYENHPRVFMQSLFFSLFLRDAYGCIKLKNSSDSQ